MNTAPSIIFSVSSLKGPNISDPIRSGIAAETVKAEGTLDCRSIDEKLKKFESFVNIPWVCETIPLKAPFHS